jgi:hypothetical protein
MWATAEAFECSASSAHVSIFFRYVLRGFVRKGLSLQAGPITNYRIGNEVIVFKRARLAPAAASASSLIGACPGMSINFKSFGASRSGENSSTKDFTYGVKIK